MTWLRYRFSVSIEACKDDYRPMTWPPVGPYWCSGFNDTHFILIAYVQTEEQLMQQWPEAEDLDLTAEKTEIEFTSRFPQPSWWQNESTKRPN